MPLPPRHKPFVGDPKMKDRIVTVTLEFRVPARENEPGDKPETRYSNQAEEHWNFWRDVVDHPERIEEELTNCLEAEYSLCDYKTVTVLALTVSDAAAS